MRSPVEQNRLLTIPPVKHTKRMLFLCREKHNKSPQGAGGLIYLGGNMQDTTELARKLLEKGILNEPTFSFAELCQIRDALMILARYSLEDKSLLEEVNKYIQQKGGE